jgi:hypothetical protein
MKTVEEIKQERDAELQGMEERYRERQDEVAKDKEAAKNENDLDRYEKLQEHEDKNFDNYKEERAEVWDYHQKEIDEAEKENDDPQK